ncbi:uncharacterized protein LOC134209444 [Armigeres subalbatus]|uniref:uncharacterized protein LOC134209444 n=1 Tax=Armigeres subalbatus TaxID=124917 RepID=UPI002ED29262
MEIDPWQANPVDYATKWSSLPKLSSEDRWFNGPDFLQRPEDDWPQPNNHEDSTDNELRTSLLVHHTLPKSVLCVNNPTWERLRKVVAYIHRFADNWLNKSRGSPTATGSFEAKQLLKAERTIIRLCQQEFYLDEMTTLQPNDPKPR